MKTILVIGGAGYIGSHMAKHLSRSETNVVILDNLSTGIKTQAKYGRLVEGDLGDPNLLDSLFSNYKFDGIMHFAASSIVSESVLNPGKYYKNNVANTLTLLEAMRRHNVNNFIFSSTAAIFGEPKYLPIDETHPQDPINPYGFTKLAVEKMLKSYASAYGIHSVCLRYFNACGADIEGELGECHQPETHLIPLVLQTASGRRAEVTVFGRDYPTSDGTCVRDYIHVQDICSAHATALDLLIGNKLGGASAFNLGNGEGFSVQQVIDAARKTTNCEITIKEGKRRPGDPAVLISNSTLARKELNWKPIYDSLETIIQHAWDWEKKVAKQIIE